MVAAGFHRQQRPLYRRVLLQHQRVRQPLGIGLRDPHSNHVTTPQQLREVAAKLARLIDDRADPVDARRPNDAARLADGHGGAVRLHLQHHAGQQVPIMHRRRGAVCHGDRLDQRGVAGCLRSEHHAAGGPLPGTASGALVHRQEAVLNGPLRRLLQPQIQRRVHREAAAVQRRRAIRVFQMLAHVLDEIRRLVDAVGDVRTLAGGAQRLLTGRCRFFRGQVTLVQHAPQDVRPPPQAALRVSQR